MATIVSVRRLFRQTGCNFVACEKKQAASKLLIPERQNEHAGDSAGQGVIFIMTHRELGPAWYPIALVITALPCAWLGGRLYKK